MIDLSNDIWELGIIGVCLVFSAVFSASETAITSLGIMKARHLYSRKEKPVRHLHIWLKHPDRILTTILIFNNAVNIFAAALATDLATRFFASQAIGIATGIMTFLILIFGEIVPKAFARAHYQSSSLFLMHLINVLYRLFFPLVWLLAEFANIIIKKLGSHRMIHPTITEDELEFLVNEGEKAGVLEDIKKDMISGVFDFDETKAREIMTPRTDIIAVEKEVSLQEAVELIIQSGHSRLPVYEESIDNIVGIVFAKDLLRHLSKFDSQKTPSIVKIMREPLFVPESKALIDVFKDLKRTKNHLAVVIDEYGGTAGIVTMEDTLEEIVGDIQDEFDSEEAEIMEVDNGIYEVSGSMNISEFLEYFGLEDSFDDELEGEVDTIGGWVTQLLGDLPEVGQTITREPLTIEVYEVSRHRIEKVRVVKMLNTPANAENN